MPDATRPVPGPSAGSGESAGNPVPAGVPEPAGTTPGGQRAGQRTEQRVGKKRLAVEQALNSLDDFVTTQELHRILEDGGDAVHLATVYRVLQALADEGRVDVLRAADGEAMYRRCAATHHHHHLVCRDCGRAVDIEAPMVEQWAARVAAENGYTEVEHTVEIYGLCPECTRRRDSSRQTR